MAEELRIDERLSLPLSEIELRTSRSNRASSRRRQASSSDTA